MLYHIGQCRDYITNYTGKIPDLNHVKTAFALLDSSGDGPVTLNEDTTTGLTVGGPGDQDATDFLNNRFFNHVGQADISSLFFVDEVKVTCRDNSGNDIYPDISQQPYPILSLPMKDISGQTLTGLTVEYQKEEQVTLDRCKEKSFIAVKKHTITIPEKNHYLIVSLKRFDKQNKLKNLVIAEDHLTVGEVKFTLRGIIYHSGRVTDGHYVYHLKTGDDWTTFNDKTVTSGVPISEEIKNSGYVYLYERELGSAAVPAQASAAVPAVPTQASAAVPANLTNFLTRQSISVNANWSILEPVQTIPDEIKPYIGETKSFVRAPAEFKGEYEFLKVHGLAFLVGTDMFIHEAAKQLYGDGGAFTNKNAAKYLRLMYTYTLPGRKRALESANGLATNTEAGVSVQTQLNKMQSYLNRIEVVMGLASTQALTGALLPAKTPTRASTQALTQAPTPPAPAPTPPAPAPTPPPQPLPPTPPAQPLPPPALDPSGQKDCKTCTLLNNAGATHCAACGASLEKPSAVIVMRHGVRADFPRSSSRSSSLSLCEQKDISNAWAMLGKSLGTTNTETERPYDTPLCEYTRPKEAYNDISDRFSQITRIVTSPFVRCVQTAAAIAAQLPNDLEIFVNRNLGEKYSTLRTYTENNPIKRLTFQELTSDELERVFKQAYKDAGSKEFKGKVMLREDPKWNEFNDDRAWFNMLDTEIKKEIRQKGDGTLLLITHGDVARIINNHDKDFDNTGIRLWLLDYCGYYTNISEPTKPDEFSTEWKAGKFIISAAVGQSINK